MPIDPEDAGRLQISPLSEGGLFQFRVLCGACKDKSFSLHSRPIDIVHLLATEGWTMWDEPFGWVCPACKAFLDSVQGVAHAD